MSGLCVNCLRVDDVRAVDVGPDQGSQRDPWRAHLMLCTPCAHALTNLDLETFHDRYATERLAMRADLAPRLDEPT